MAAPSSSRCLTSAFKRLKLSPSATSISCQTRRIQSSSQQSASLVPQDAQPSDLQTELANVRLPKAVQATYLNPLRREPTHNITVAELQLRSYSVRNLEVFADFAMRAAYFLNLPAQGPKPLPRITQRWTVPRSNFVHKKSQENFERITLRRSIRILDGHPETVATWLAFLRKHQYYGVGLKANVWENGGLHTAADMDTQAAKLKESIADPFDAYTNLPKDEDKVRQEAFKAQWGAHAALGGSQSVESVKKRIQAHVVGRENKSKEIRTTRPSSAEGEAAST